MPWESDRFGIRRSVDRVVEPGPRSTGPCRPAGGYRAMRPLSRRSFTAPTQARASTAVGVGCASPSAQRQPCVRAGSNTARMTDNRFQGFAITALPGSAGLGQGPPRDLLGMYNALIGLVRELNTADESHSSATPRRVGIVTV
jgi:hypothetical protein